MASSGMGMVSKFCSSQKKGSISKCAGGFDRVLKVSVQVFDRLSVSEDDRGGPLAKNARLPATAGCRVADCKRGNPPARSVRPIRLSRHEPAGKHGQHQIGGEPPLVQKPMHRRQFPVAQGVDLFCECGINQHIHKSMAKTNHSPRKPRRSVHRTSQKHGIEMHCGHGETKFLLAQCGSP